MPNSLNPNTAQGSASPGNRIFIAGGSGLVGQRLSELLTEAGYQVMHLSRRANIHSRYPVYEWDPEKGTIDERALLQADAIINLAGAGVADKRWTETRKAEILSSRVNGAKTIAKYLSTGKYPVKTYLSASANGYYGDQGDRWCTEETQAGIGFLAEVCTQWEAAAASVAATGVRTVCLRIGIVFSSKGGALQQLLQTLRLGVSPYFGGGNQYWSWIDIDDLCGMFRFALEHKDLEGVFNANAPEPATSYNIATALKHVSKGFSVALPAPSFVLSLALGKMSTALTDSTRCSSDKIRKAGYVFQYEDLEAVLKRYAV